MNIMMGARCIAYGLSAFSAIGALGAEDLASIEADKPAQIAEMVKPSLVVVSHIGRNGEVDGLGSGFVVSADGLIATCFHVIGEARPIRVAFADGREFSVVEVHAWDSKLDLALLKIDAKDLPFLPLGDSDLLEQGHGVLAMGNPHGLDFSLVQGVVSGVREFEGQGMIQLAMPIEPGNSGGPLLDMKGNVQGLLALKSAVSENLGFAMPVNALKLLLEKPNPVPMVDWRTIGMLDEQLWKPLMGAQWTRRAGRIIVSGRGDGFGGRALCLWQGTVPEKEYELSVKVRLDDESGAAGLAFSSDDGDKHYGFYPSNGQIRLTRFGGPDVYSWNILEDVIVDTYRPGEWNLLKVRVSPERIVGYVNNEEVLSVEDKAFRTGKVGLAKFRSTVAEFKNFIVAKEIPVEVFSPERTKTLNDKIDRLLVGSVDSKIHLDILSDLSRDSDLSKHLLNERADELEARAKHLRGLIEDVHFQNVKTKLNELLTVSDEPVDLFRAGLMVALFDKNELEVETYMAELERMAQDFLETEKKEEKDPRKQVELLVKYLFSQQGFHGSRTDYYNRSNSYLDEVLEDREGLPITLAILFIELARRVGLENAHGIGLPGHFVVEYRFSAEDRMYIDVFDRGKTLTLHDLNDIVISYLGRTLRESDLKPYTARAIIVRMLENLKGIALESSEPMKALRYMDLLVALLPDEPYERLARGLFLYANKMYDEARLDFAWLLDKQPEGIDLSRLKQLYHSLDPQ